MLQIFMLICMLWIFVQRNKIAHIVEIPQKILIWTPIQRSQSSFCNHIKKKKKVKHGIPNALLLLIKNL